MCIYWMHHKHVHEVNIYLCSQMYSYVKNGGGGVRVRYFLPVVRVFMVVYTFYPATISI